MQQAQQYSTHHHATQRIGGLCLAIATSLALALFSVSAGWGAVRAEAATTATKITTQPKSVTSINHAAVYLQVKAKGTKLTYRWYIKKKSYKTYHRISKAYKPASGYTKSKLRIKPTKSYNGAKLRVVVTGKKGHKTSKSVTLTMKSATKTAVSTQPKDVKVKKDARVTMSVKAKGTKLTYRWYIKKTTDSRYKLITSAYASIKGERTSKVSVKATKSYQGARLRVVVAGLAGTQTSASAKITLTNVAAPKATSSSKSSTSGAGLSSASYGIDLSSWQSSPNGVSVDYSLMPSRGFRFLIARLGSSEKCAAMGSRTQRMDTAYKTHVQSARNTGLAVGHYWFNGAGDPAVDARYFVDHLASYQAGDPLILDIEPHYYTVGGKCVHKNNWTPAMVLEWVNTVKSKIKHANVYIYMSQSTLSERNWAPVAKVTRLWVARFGKNDGTMNDKYAPNLKYWSKWSIWQYSSKMKSPAVTGKTGNKINLDANYATADAWEPLN